MAAQNSTSTSSRTLLECVRDILSGFTADAVGAAASTAVVGAGAAATAGAAVPALGLFAVYLGLRYTLARDEAKEKATFEDSVHAWLSSADQEARIRFAEQVVHEFDSTLDLQEILDRLEFLSLAVESTRLDGQEAAEAIEKALAKLNDLERGAIDLQRILATRTDELLAGQRQNKKGIEDIRALLRPQPTMAIPRAPYEKGARWGALLYKTRGVKFVGREALMDQLHRFVEAKDETEAPRLFAWTLCLGPGGAGKSRAALELCLGYESTHRVGFLDRFELGRSWSPEKWRTWQPVEPNLIIIDYVSLAAERAAELVALLADRSRQNDLAHPVRLLLLERSTPGPWEESMWGKQLLSREADVADHFWTDGGPMPSALPKRGELHDRYAPLVADHLGDEALWCVMCDLFDQLDVTVPEKGATLARLGEIDAEARPLFAVLLSYLLAENKTSEDREWTKDTLLQSAIVHERRRWAKEIDGGGEVDVKYINLLCLATLCNGLSRQGGNDPLSQVELSGFLPSLADFDRNLYEHMTGESAEDQLAPLTPDILGEYFALEHMERNLESAQRRLLVNWAWRLKTTDYDTGRGIGAVLMRMAVGIAPQSALRNTLAAAFLALPGHGSARLAWGNLAVHLIPIVGHQRAWEEVQSLIQKLREFRKTDVCDESRKCLAAGLLNLTLVFGLAGRVADTEDVLDELSQLRAEDDRPEIRTRLARGLVNLANTLRVAGRNADGLVVVDRLRILQAEDNRSEIRIALAKGIVNLIIGFSNDAEFTSAKELLRELRELQKVDNCLEIRDQVAVALFSCTSGLAVVGRVTEGEKLLSELLELRLVDNRPAIRDLAAAGVSNWVFSFGSARLVPRTEIFPPVLRELWKVDKRLKLAEYLADSFLGLIESLVTFRRVNDAKDLLTDLRLICEYHNYREFRARLAKGIALLTVGSMTAGEHTLGETLLDELRAIYSSYHDSGVGVTLARTVLYIANLAESAGNFTDAKKLHREAELLMKRNGDSSSTARGR